MSLQALLHPYLLLARLALSTDATEPLLEFDPTKVYVIGGIVDRSVKKGITSKFAVGI